MGSNDPGIRNIRLALRMPIEHVRIFNEVEAGQSTQTEIARKHGISKQRVGQIVAKARDILMLARTPTPAIAKAMDVIQAEACAMAGYKTPMQVIDALHDNTIPKWWPAEITVALCRLYDVAVPGRATRKVADLLMRASVNLDASKRLLGEAADMLKDVRSEENQRLLEAVQKENTPSLEKVLNELGGAT